jgi:L-alanine-DL-glutamate epimerase-like enolase superfamily enzyme
MDQALESTNRIKIERVSPVTLRAARWYEEWVIVRILTDQGIEGVGEGFTWSGQASAIRSHIESIGEQISGTRPVTIEAFLRQFLSAQATDRNWYAAVSAIEIALWDILGKMAGVPVFSLLGEPVHKAIPLYADHGIFDGAKSWEEQLERILKAKEAGFAMFKWDPFVGWGTIDPKDLGKQVDRVRQVREAVGKDYQLAIDAHNRFNVDGAIMAARSLEPFDILFFEAPTEDDPEMLRKVADTTSIPLATGELTCTRRDAKALLDSRALTVFQPEVGNNGGLLESCRTAALAELYDVKIAMHNWCGPVVTRAASHVCVRTSNLLYQEYAGGAPQNEWENDLLHPPAQIENGHMILPDGPGLGSALNEALLASRRID